MRKSAWNAASGYSLAAQSWPYSIGVSLHMTQARKNPCLDERDNFQASFIIDEFLTVQCCHGRKDHSCLEDLVTARIAMLTVHSWGNTIVIQRIIKMWYELGEIILRVAEKEWDRGIEGQEWSYYIVCIGSFSNVKETMLITLYSSFCFI